MSNSANLALPLLQAAQAQKHVTVNEAITLLDGIVQLRMQSATINTPPPLPNEGDCYGLPVACVNEWSGYDGDIAIFSNGGWVFVTPTQGWSGWVADASATAIFDGSDWKANVAAVSTNGASMAFSVAELDHTIGAGASSAVTLALPAGSIVFGVTGRVTIPMSGALTGWRLGVPGTDNRYGNALGVSTGSWVRGMTSSPLTYYSAEDLVLTSEGADFVDGEVRLAIHYAQLGLPSL